MSFVRHVLIICDCYMICRTIPLRRKQHELELQQWLAIPEADRSQYEPPIQPLKLVIMSATMRVNDFKNPKLFATVPPVVKVGVVCVGH